MDRVIEHNHETTEQTCHNGSNKRLNKYPPQKSL